MRLDASQSSDVAGVIRPRNDKATVTSGMHETASEQEPPAKRIRVDVGTAPVGVERTKQPQTDNIQTSKLLQHPQLTPASETSGIGQSSVVTSSPRVSNSSGSSSAESLHPPAAASESVAPLPAAAPPTARQSVDSSPTMVPLKSTMMAHLRTKYRGELEYMLLEFRKLERQLLGAKGAAQIEESAGSRERREKLHSFILHLEDTIRQIEEGCRLEAGTHDASTSTAPTKENSAETGTSVSRLNSPTAIVKRKETEESVQKLEEHILANLLPVKVRLKKQLAAQQGATRNPAGMPAPRRGSYVASSNVGAKGTFAAAAEQRQKQAEAARLAAQQQQEEKMREVSDPTQFGTPLKGGSSLTRNLHGATLGSKQRTHGHGVGASTKSNDEPTGSRILYGGMVPESTQHRSGVAAASGVHDMVIEDPSLMTPTETVDITEPPELENHPSPQLKSSALIEVSTEQKILSHKPQNPKVVLPPPPTIQQPKPAPVRSIKTLEMTKETCNKDLTEDERRKMRKNRRKRKLLRIARRRERERQRLVVAQPPHPAHVPVKVVGGGLKKAVMGKNNGRKKGPRAVEYICALCNDPYNSTCDYNPWWALAQQECPKCRKVQIPRIDITAPANQIEYHPALLAHIDDNGGNVGASASAVSQYLPKPSPPLAPHARLSRPIQHPFREPLPPGSDSDSDLSELSDGSLSDLSVGSHDSEFDLSSLTPAEQAEHETFGHKYKGPVLSEEHASRLLVLMQHSSTCPCKHKSKRHRDVCRSVKYLMLHVRDCPGTTSNFDVCPFPWCRKVKHMLYHLVSCTTPEQCKICSPTNLSPSLQALDGLNQFRVKKYRERLISFMKRSAAARRAAVPLTYSGKKTGPQPPYMTAKGVPKANTAVYQKHPARSVPPSTATRKGKKSGTPSTKTAIGLSYAKPSPTPTVRHPWTGMQNGDPKAPAKQSRAPIPQHVQTPKGTHVNVLGKTHPAGSINGVRDKVPGAPTYTSVEDPLRASAVNPVQTPVKASISPGTKAHAVPKPPVPQPATSSLHQIPRKAGIALPSGNDASDPIAGPAAQQVPRKPSSSNPTVMSTATKDDRVFGATASQVGQNSTMPTKVPQANATSQSSGVPVTRHLQSNSEASVVMKPVASAFRDAAAATSGLPQQGVTKAPVQPALPSDQDVAQTSPSVGSAPAKLVAVLTHKPSGASSVSLVGNSEMRKAPMPSAQPPNACVTRVKVEPAIVPELQLKKEVPLPSTAKPVTVIQKPVSSVSAWTAGNSESDRPPMLSAQPPHLRGTNVTVESGAIELKKELPPPAVTSHAHSSARTEVPIANLAPPSTHHDMKVSTAASTTQHVTCEPASVSTQGKSAESGTTSSVVNSQPTKSFPVEARSTLHVGAPALSGVPASGQVQAQTKPVTHSTTAAKSQAVTEKSVLVCKRTSSQDVTKTVSEPTTVGSLRGSAKIVTQSSPGAASASFAQLSSTNTKRYPGESAPSCSLTGEPDCGKAQTLAPSTQPSTSTLGTPANKDVPFETGPPTGIANTAKLPIGAAAHAPPEPAQNDGIAPFTRPPATGTQLLESQPNPNNVVYPRNHPSPAHVEDKQPVTELVQTQQKIPPKAVEQEAAVPRTLAQVQHDVTKVSASSPLEEKPAPAPAPTWNTTSAPQTGIPATGVTGVVHQKMVQDSLHPEVATSSPTPSVQTGKAISQSSSASKQTKLDAGRSVPPSTAERPVETRNVQQPADIVKVGG